MAVAFDAVSTGTTGVSPRTWTHTCTGAQLVLVVDVAFDNVAVGGTRTVSYVQGGSTVNLVSQGTRLSGGTGQTVGFFERFLMVAPDTGAHTVTVSWSGLTPASVQPAAISFTGADQSSGLSSQTGGDSAAANVTSGSLTQTSTTSGNMVLGGFTDGSGNAAFTAGTSRYAIGALASGAAGFLTGATAPSTGSSVTISWTQNSDFWGGLICEVLAAAAGTDSSPGYATSAADLGGGSGSWASTGNADGAPDATYATWTSP